jgi:hypothetical protein
LTNSRQSTAAEFEPSFPVNAPLRSTDGREAVASFIAKAQHSTLPYPAGEAAIDPTNRRTLVLIGSKVTHFTKRVKGKSAKI